MVVCWFIFMIFAIFEFFIQPRLMLFVGELICSMSMIYALKNLGSKLSFGRN
jgi:hypothetical protein